MYGRMRLAMAMALRPLIYALGYCGRCQLRVPVRGAPGKGLRGGVFEVA